MPTILTQGQRLLLGCLLWLAILVLANSAYLFVASPGARDLTLFYQLMLLGHLAGGSLLLLAATVFLVWHLGRVSRRMHLSAWTSGGALALVAYLLFASGLFILYESNSRDHYWILISHRALALLAPALYGVHRLVSHFPPAGRAIRRGAVAFLVLLAAMLAPEVLRARGVSSTTFVSDRPDPFVPFRPRNFPAESAPFFPSSATSGSGGRFPAATVTRGETEGAIGAETCRRCHPDTVAQWEASAHRFASFNNPFYRAAVDTLREEVSNRASQWCGGCHDPALLFPGDMTEEIDVARPESRAGLTCLACHLIDQTHGLAGNGNYNLADDAPSPYLGDGARSGPLRFLADQLIKSKPAAHKRRLKQPFFETSEYCLACHKVSLDVPVNGYRYLRGQDEYDHWHDSGVSRNAARTFYLPKGRRECRDCHMPLEAAPLGDVSAQNGVVRSHRFIAVNTALPFLRGDRDTIRRVEAFLRGRLRVDLFAVRYADGTMVRALDAARPVLPPGEAAVFEVVVRNRGVGHTFPGGTNDSNQGWIDFRITDEEGRELYRSGALDERGYVDPAAHFYRVVFVRHDGTEGDRRDAWNFHVAAFSRVIGPGTADVARFAFQVPKELAGRRVRIEARLLWRKFNRRYTEFVFSRPGISVPDLPHLRDRRVPDLPVTVIAATALSLDVSDRRPDAVPDTAPLADAVPDTAPVAGAVPDTAPVAGAVPDAGPAADGAASPALWERFNDHGIASLLQGAFDVAEASFREVARLRPDLPDGWRNLARRWIASATPGQAEPFLRKMDEASPRDPQRPYFWGRYFERLEEYELAEEAYRESLVVFPDDRDAWRRLGAVRYKLHRYEASLAAYLAVLAIDPEDVEAHKRRLDIYSQLGQADEAAAAKEAFQKYRQDEQAAAVARDFLLQHEEINREAQPRHVHR